MTTSAKDPEKARALAKAYYELAKEGVTGEDYDTAGAAASKAETLARALRDTALSERVAELKKDLAVLKSELQKVKASMDNPSEADADSVGRYLCFIRNDWARGLKVLSEGGKAPLKELATKDLAAPASAESQVEIGDGWWQQALAEKVAWKKLNILSRARFWYDQAQPAAIGLVKIKLDKRLAEMESAAPGGGLNLLALIDPKRDAVHGEWTIEDGILVDKGEQTLVLQIPYQPPDEYDLHIKVKRAGGVDSAMVGFVVGGTQAVVLVDGYQTNNIWLSGFEMLDGKLLREQSGCYKGKQLIGGDKPATITVQVRKTSVTLSIDGKKLLGVEGSQMKLSNRADSGTPDRKSLFIGGWNGKLGFTDIRITPLSGPGKKTR